MSDLSQKILGTIKNEEITPRSKYYFILKNISFWAGGIIFFLLGVLATTLVFFFLNHLEILDFLQRSPRLLLKSSIIFIPVFWIIASIAFLFFIGISIGKTKKGYTYPPLLIFLGTLIFQIFLGFLLSNTTWAEDFGEKTKERMHFAQIIQTQQEKIWSNPEEGFLAGKIIEIHEEFLRIKSFQTENDEWKIIITPKTKMPEKFPLKELKEGTPIKSIGEVTGDHEFTAKGIRIFKRKNPPLQNPQEQKPPQLNSPPPPFLEKEEQKKLQELRKRREMREERSFGENEKL
jgi:hypothetical protein